MGNYNFGEKKTEYSPKYGEELPVWQSPKYAEAKAKAVEILDSGKYGLKESDFWILQNATKNKKVAYTGLIISHNGCLKINDRLPDRFDPACVSLDKDGFNASLVYTYCSPTQGIYEVGEVSASNCKNEYPYAMAFKRCFDRVVLKLSKLAYSGIYSDSESDEFAKQLKSDDTQDMSDFSAAGFICERCGGPVLDSTRRDGSVWPASDIVEYGRIRFHQTLCKACQKALAKEIMAKEKAEAPTGETA